MFDLTDNYYEDYNYNLSVNSPDITDEEIKQIISHKAVESYSILYEAKGSYKIKRFRQNS